MIVGNAGCQMAAEGKGREEVDGRAWPYRVSGLLAGNN